MNSDLDTRLKQRTTRAAEGLGRWRWTVAEFDRMIEVGLLGEEDRVELIRGELVPMAAKGIRHENLRALLAHGLAHRLGDDIMVIAELGWRPSDDTYLEPDIIIIPAREAPSLVPAPDVRLLIEVADTSIVFDQETKAPLYAALGVAEYWIINAETLETRVHREPSGEAYRKVADKAPGDRLAPKLLPGLAFSLEDLLSR